MSALRSAGVPCFHIHVQPRPSAAREGGIKLQFEGSPDRGGDNLSPQLQAHSARDKLSPPRKAELELALAVQAVFVPQNESLRRDGETATSRANLGRVIVQTALGLLAANVRWRVAQGRVVACFLLHP